MALVDLLNVSKHYEAQKILEGINFHVDEGERIVIVGKNGSGKSTIARELEVRLYKSNKLCYVT